jgi:hypothetical protein
MTFRRRRFGDVVRRQLDAFVDDNAAFLSDVADAEVAYDRAGREEAEERYARYEELVEIGGEVLVELRDAYARTLDEEAEAEYATEFERAVRKRLSRFAGALAD